MLIVITVIAAVSLALLIGMVWGLWGPLPDKLEGALIAAGGGALIISVVSELLEPAAQSAPFWALALCTLAGATLFSLLDRWVDTRFSGSAGLGLLLAITLDGVPENLALGVALIGAGWTEVAALAGSIFLSNLPEAAGGAREMHKSNMSTSRIVMMWVATVILLAGAALAGNILLADAPQEPLALIKCFAAGAVVASLATEVFPKAFKLDRYQAGVAVTLGLLAAFGLNQLS